MDNNITYDLLITNGRIVDIASNMDQVSDIAILNDNKSEGIWALKQIAKRKESPVDVLNQVGLLYFEMGEIDSALFEFNQVYKLDSLNIFALHFLSQIYKSPLPLVEISVWGLYS